MSVLCLVDLKMAGSQCRHCTELETLPHVLGFCRYGALLRNTRHHAIRELIAKNLLPTFEVHQEVHCIAEQGSSRRVDIIAIDREKDTAIIIDPTVRFETGENQPLEVNEEKKGIYEATVNYLKEKYHISGNIAVFGLLIGARGTIPKFLVQFCKKYKIPVTVLKDIATTAVKYSIQILRNYLCT